MLFSDNQRIQDTRAGFQWINGRINTQRCDITIQHGFRVQMRKGSSRSRVCQIIRRHIDRLYRCDGTILCRCDTLLQLSHFCRKGRLISNGTRHTSQQGAYFTTCLGKTEDIVDEQQHVLMVMITEVFRHRKTCQTNTHSGTRRFIHLSVNQYGLIQDTAVLHFMIHVISFTGSLPDTGNDGHSTMFLGDIVNQLLDQYGFSYSRTAKQTNLTTLGIWAKQVNDLNSCFQHFCGCLLLLKARCLSVNRQCIIRSNRSQTIYFTSEDIKHSSQNFLTNRYTDR